MKKPTVYGKHDDIHLGFTVIVMTLILLIGLALLPMYPIVSNVFVVVALSAFALFEALFDYRK